MERPTPHPVPVVLDTDIGTDVDDLLALLLLAGEPTVDLRAVTTVYGDVHLRARLAARVLRLLGDQDVPVHAGVAEPRSGRDVWWAGHEGGDLADLDAEVVADVSGVDALIAAAEAHAGELVIVAIGPLTNIATALERDPSFATAVNQLVVMGGEFVAGEPEHNLRSDTVAAREVLASGIPCLFVGLDTTTTVWFGEDDLDTATAADTPLARLVDAQVRDWWRFIDDPRCHPHDPLAVLAMLEPERFEFERAGWRVIEEGESAGALVRDPTAPPIERVVSVEVEVARASIARRLAATIASS